MEENIIKPLEEGLSMFSMNFASKGFSWAEDLYQKWENICQNNIIVQEPSKIVDTVGGQVRKIYEEVADDWLNPFSFGCDKAPVSDLSLDQDVTADACEESMTSHDKEAFSEGSLICPMSALAIGLKEIDIVSLPETEKDERKETCDLFDKQLKFTPSEPNICSCSSEIRYDNEEVSNPSTSTSHSGSLPPADEVSISELPESEVEGEFMQSKHSVPMEEAANYNFIDESLPFIRNSSLVDTFAGNLTSQEEVSLATGLKEIKIVSLPDTEKHERKETCKLFDKKIEFTPPEANTYNCSSEVRYDNEEVSNLSTSTSHSGSLPPVDKVSLSELLESKVEGEFMLSEHSDPMEEAGKLTSQEGVSLVQSFSSVHEHRSSLIEPEASLSIMDISFSFAAAGSSDCFSEHKTQFAVVVDKNIETSEEFEDVSLEDYLDEKTPDDCWKEAESYELSLIAHRAMKNRSYKKKLRDAFTSRFCSFKKNDEREASFHGDISAELAKMGITSPSPVSRVSEASDLLTLESSESDWELL